MSENAGKADGNRPTQGFVIRRTLAMFGGAALCMLAGTYAEIHVLKFTGVFEQLKATGIYDSAFVAGSGFAVFLPFAVARLRNVLHWLVFFVGSVPFTIWYAASGTLAGLAVVQLGWQSGVTVKIAVFLLCVAPVMRLHISLFRRFGMISDVTSDAILEMAPSDASRGLKLNLPGILLISVVADFLGATGIVQYSRQFSGGSVVFLAWIASMATNAFKSDDARFVRRLMAVKAAAMVIAGLTIIGAALLSAAFWTPRREIDVAIFTAGAIIFAAKPILKPVARRFGLELAGAPPEGGEAPGN